MRISHKRNIQRKLHKQKPLFSHPVFAVKKMPEVELVIDTPVIADTAISKPVTASKSAVRLTPKQQQVFDIVVSHADGLNPKGIGLQAGQDESKAASWATGALKKLTEQGRVERIQLAGNKVLYKAL
ncbi:MarR family transcriptional regulator [Photobacterium iliopiscarium]|uniref:MarR family transcriptional regulator n=1 Tax=Photobacterium iliopiscarium TaxID=56192 RepID=UPI001E3D3BD4|nr:MarR family transcriptional regulator [Photobacterium iliopiscarium]MCD9468620.1 MarR family transcriptional regulator [Photobacterium iliopiscarium]MCD9488610.1 MarR family transcriptional regulator [Photobacterium iliopiscarium]MCF2245347.1 MarR family transcriptional regulator [Photobacterium iliopiscarium]